VSKVHRELEDSKVHRDNAVIKVRRAPTDSKDHKEKKEILVVKVASER
jgi:hypothetical protein